MKRNNICALTVPLLLLTTFALSTLSRANPRQNQWREETSDHFIVYYLENSSFASEVAAQAERLYEEINSDLGMENVIKARHLSFWLWDDRCKIYLYRNQTEYVHSTGAPAWSGGFVKYRERIIHSYAGAETFLNSVLPHEMAHILFREFVGFDNPEVPLWLDEGVAQYAEASKRQAALESIVQSVREHRMLNYLRFSQFNKMGLGGADGETARVFYGQAISVVHYLINDQGKSRFVDFCANLRDGYSVGRALSFATGSEIGSLEELEEGWREFVVGLAAEKVGEE